MGYSMRFLALLFVSFLFSSCGGLTYVGGENTCTGPYCDQGCSVRSECPAGTYCVAGRCSTTNGGGGGGGGDSLGGGDQNQGNGDNLGGGENGAGDDLGSGDGLGGDGNGNGDGLGGGDGTGGGDTRPGGDEYLPNGDESNGGGGCVDLDNDGFCSCAPCPQPDCAGFENDNTVYPGAPELCDGKDNDCTDAFLADVEAFNACGNCLSTIPQPPLPYCSVDNTWSGNGGIDYGNLPTPGPGNHNDGSTIIIDTDNPNGNGYGSITLGSESNPTTYAWPTSETEGTASRIDTVVGVEVGRYATAVRWTGDVNRPWIAPWAGTNQECAEPSRTTIDGDGNAYIANRAAGGTGTGGSYSGSCSSQTTDPRDFGSVTKVGYFDNALLCDGVLNPGFVGCQCIDRNVNGRIDTSKDYDLLKNGIQLPSCSGGNCGTSCVQDNDCPVASPYCIRDLYPSQTNGKCSSAAPKGAPCSGNYCATTCTTHTNCSAANLGASTDHYCIYDNSTTSHRCSNYPFTPEFLGQDDECIIWTRRIPGQDANVTPDNTEESEPRGMAIDKQGFIWVGTTYTSPGYAFKLRNDGEFVCPYSAGCCPDGANCSGGANLITQNAVCPRKAWTTSTPRSAIVDPSTCASATNCFHTIDSTCRINLDLQPYGAVVDGGKVHPNNYGYVWFVGWTDGRLQRIDTETGLKSQVVDIGTSYGITVDHQDRIWVAGSSTSLRPTVHRFNATTLSGVNLVSNWNGTTADATGKWDTFTVADTSPWSGIADWRGRGITTQLVDLGGGNTTSRIWANFNRGWDGGDSSYLTAFDSGTGSEQTSLQIRTDPACDNPIGAGIGYSGLVWVVNLASYDVCAFDPEASMSLVHDVTIGQTPYTYSDFTGNLFNTFTNPQGKYRVLIQGCPICYVLSDWGKLTWIADVPTGAQLFLRYRTGNTIGEALDPAGAMEGPIIPDTAVSFGPPNADRYTFTYDIPIGVGGIYMQVEFEFIAGPGNALPVLHKVDAGRACDWTCE